MTWCIEQRPSERDFLIRRADTDPLIVVRPREPQSEDQRLDAVIVAQVVADALARTPHCVVCGSMFIGERGEQVCADCREAL